MVQFILFCMLAVLVQGAVCARWPRWRYGVVALCLLAGVAAAVLLVSSAGQDSVQYSVLLADGTAKMFDTQAAAEDSWRIPMLQEVWKPFPQHSGIGLLFFSLLLHLPHVHSFISFFGAVRGAHLRSKQKMRNGADLCPRCFCSNGTRAWRCGGRTR